MKLYRFGHTKRAVIDPHEARKHAHVGGYSKREYASAGYPRTFWYVDRKDREPFITGKYCHELSIADEHIYDISDDPDGFKMRWERKQGIDALLNMVHDAGYIGILYNSGFQCVVLFEPVRVDWIIYQVPD